MNTLPLMLATGLYVWQAGNFAYASKYGMLIVFAGYAIANVGLIIAARLI